MTIDANALLRTLGGTLSGAGGSGKISGAAGGAEAKATGGLDFANLLAKARAGEIHSGIKVSAARDAGLQLNDEQLTRLSAAADLAEANGIGRGLFLIDGKQVVMDVGTRQVLGEVTASQAGVVEGVDGVVSVPTVAQGGSASAATIAPGAGLAQMSNASLLNALAQRGTQAA